MPCYHPITAWRPLHADINGKRALRFGAEHKFPNHEKVEVSCGKCIGCRLEHSRQWALRCKNELQFHEDAMFITLTFDDRNIPADWSISVAHVQKFLKRLRKSIEPKKIRYFAAGEYGEPDELHAQFGNKLGRPHYHMIIFGHRFPDMVIWKKSKNNHDLMMSEQLNKLWPYGNANIGQVNFETCAYTARYVTKKINGDQAQDHYRHINPVTGESNVLVPEFCTMSRRPALGRAWYDCYKSDIKHDGQVFHNGIKMNMPKYYEKLMDEENPHDLETIKINRQKFADSQYLNNTEERLAVREECKIRQTQHFERGNF